MTKRPLKTLFSILTICTLLTGMIILSPAMTVRAASSITVNPSSGLITNENNGTDTFTIVLDTQPSEDVTIGLSSSDSTEGIVSPASLLFTSANWSIPQTVTVIGVNDSEVDSNVSYSIITAPAISSDLNFNGIDAFDVSVTNNDVNIDQSQEDIGMEYPPGTLQTTAQTFTVGTTGQFEKIAVFLEGSAAWLDYVTVEVRTVESEVPTSTILASSTVMPDYNYTGWVEFPLSPQPSLVSGTQYAIVLTVENPNQCWITWDASAYDSYPLGVALSLDTSSGWQMQDNMDFAFRVHRLTRYTVTFVLGDQGTLTGGGALVQTVTEGQAAVAPTFSVASGWTFIGWDTNFSSVTSDITVTARYGNTLFQQPPRLSSDAAVNSYSSTTYSVGPYECADDFSGVTSYLIEHIQWYGVAGKWPNWLPGDPSGMKFRITFYQRNDQTFTQVAQFSDVTPTYQSYGGIFPFGINDDLQGYCFDVDLPSPVSLTAGWVSIQSTYSPDESVFLWLNSSEGTNNCICFGDWGEYDRTSFLDNLAFTLTGTTPKYTVTFEAGENGSLSGTTTFSGIASGTAWESAVTVPTPVPTSGYKFDTWSPEFPANVTESATYTANFVIDTSQTFTVTFEAGANGSLTGTTTFSDITSGTAWASAVTTLPTPVPAFGYVFDSWSPSFPEIVTANVTYTANFVPDQDPNHWFTVTFEAGAHGYLGGMTTFYGILSGTAWESAVTTLPTPVPNPGYKFDTWSPEFPANVTESATYTANFVIDTSQTFAVTYDGNDETSGTVPVDGTLYHSGDIVTVLGSDKLQKTGYYFAGWAIYYGDTEEFVWSPGGTFMGTSDVILHAKWIAIGETAATLLGTKSARPGQKVTFSATVYVAGDKVIPAGTIGFWYSTDPLSGNWLPLAEEVSVTLVHGKASLTVNSLTSPGTTYYICAAFFSDDTSKFNDCLSNIWIVIIK